MTQKCADDEFDPGPEVPDDDWEDQFQERVTATGLAQLQDLLDAVKAARLPAIRGLKLVMDFSNLQRHFLSELGATSMDGEGMEDAEQGGFIQMGGNYGRRRRRQFGHGGHGPPGDEARAVVQQAAEGARLQALTHALNGAIQLGDQPLIARLRTELYASLTPDLIPGGLGLPTPANDDIPLAPRPAPVET